MNTELCYLYRDACNYKTCFECVLQGKVSLDEIEPYLHDGDFFIPSQVCLPDLQGTRLGPDDHVWHEIASIELVPDAPTVMISAQEFMQAFKHASTAGWDIRGVLAAKGIL
ncbi:MAG: hypothetical protein ACLFV7_14040 [Phycisphaerae bacterium]